MESKRAGLSPYDYCSNNPVNKTDPNGMIDGWVDVGDGTNKVVYNSNVTTQEGAQAVYGSNATYYGEYKAPYVGVGGSTYELFENGNYLKDGVSHTATDKASIRDLGFSFTKAAIFTIVGAKNFLSSAKPKELLLATANSTLQTAALMGDEHASDAFEQLNYQGTFTAHGFGSWNNPSYFEDFNSGNGFNKTQSDLFNKMKSWDRAQWAYESGAFTASVAMSYGIGRLTSLGPGRPIAPIEGNPGSRFGMFTGTPRMDFGSWEYLKTTFNSLAEKQLLPKYQSIDPNLKAGFTGSFNTGKVGNPSKATFGNPINLNKFDIDYWIESDILYKKFGGNLRADPEFRTILSNTPGFEGLKPNKQGFSIKFKPFKK